MNDLIKEFSLKVSQELTHSRFEHCLQVAEIAKSLAEAHKYPSPENAYLAGLVHDITKQKKVEYHEQLFLQKGFNYKELPEAAWHAYSAAIVLNSEIDNKEILLAVQSHTLGNENMTVLEQIIYASDFLGSAYALKKKKHSLWLEETKKNLKFGIWLKASNTIFDLLERKANIHPFTLSTYNFSLSSDEHSETSTNR